MNDALLSVFGAGFALLPFAAVVLIATVVVSPLGAVRIGGPSAQPLLPRWNWFAITLCTTIATGILFWGTAEPIFHISDPPAFSSAEAGTPEAARFALSTMFFHWSITPYAIYAASALAFALAYYNLGGSYSLSAPFAVALGRSPKRGGTSGAAAAALDAAALFSLVAGVAASLGAGVLTLVGGLEATFGLGDSAWSRLAITLAIVAAYVVSSATGLQRGIRILSDVNVRLFFALALFVFVAGPTVELLRMGGAAVADYVREFPARSVFLGGDADQGWVRSWTSFNFANWAAWAPITALFLGRIARGYTVREFVLFNVGFPALFGVVWMTVFAGAALSIDQSSGGDLTRALQERGPEAIIYGVFDTLPLTAVLAPVFLIVTFVSFTTAMDSNTHSIAGVCLDDGGRADARDGSDDAEEEKERAGLNIKIFWGVLIGAVAWIMTSTNGVAGVKMLSNLGGAPGMLVLLGSLVALARLMAMRLRGVL